ncbi:MAG: LacI family DNA-binding transcriptional regulator [Kiritimatiellae bacterium]|nr:LacI family DNA-binding transcriptional regulator [Kiritimatiellia bacterium]
MGGKLTMQQMADELGLSRLTVSSVVNGRAGERGISRATERRVREHLERLGFVPSRQAVRLRGGRRDAVGILYSGGLYSHLTEAFNRLTGWVGKAPTNLEILVVPSDRLLLGVQELVGRGVARLAWIHIGWTHSGGIEPAVLNCLSRLETVVIYNYHFGPWGDAEPLLERGFHLVGFHRQRGFRKLARFLKKLGHRTVAFPDLSEETAAGWGIERLRAFAAEGLATVAPLPVGPRPEPLSEFGPFMAGYLCAAMTEHGVTAACLQDDEEAAFLLAELLGRGVRVPEDLTLTGYDGMPIAAAARKPLTTLAVPVASMVAATERILAGRGGASRRHCFNLKLIERATHGRARKTTARR